jgi:hypothetical protein
MVDIRGRSEVPGLILNSHEIRASRLISNGSDTCGCDIARCAAGRASSRTVPPIPSGIRKVRCSIAPTRPSAISLFPNIADILTVVALWFSTSTGAPAVRGAIGPLSGVACAEHPELAIRNNPTTASLVDTIVPSLCQAAIDPAVATLSSLSKSERIVRIPSE